MKFMMEDCIMVKGEICTAGSSILFNFKSPLNATVYEKCMQSGMEFAGLTVSNEFGIDTLFDTTDTILPAIECVLDNRCDVVLCNDIFGKLRRQAPKHGLIYIHPSYGSVSRFGLIPTVSSMDQIGILCRGLMDGLKILECISGGDINDGTCYQKEGYCFHCKPVEKVIGIADKYQEFFQTTQWNQETNPIFSANYMDVMSQVFYILASAEFSNNTNRYDGVKFGLRDEEADNINDLYIKTRSSGFSRDAKLTSLIGYMVLSKDNYEPLYYKAMQIRRLVRDYYQVVLDKYSLIALPASVPNQDKFKQIAVYSLATLCGFATVSCRVHDSDIQLIADRGSEDKLFSYAKGVLL